MTPLCNAAQAGDIDIVQKLVKAGAKLENDKEKWTPLQVFKVIEVISNIKIAENSHIFKKYYSLGMCGMFLVP